MAAMVPATSANAVSIVQQICRAVLVRKGVTPLLRHPGGGRVIGDRRVHDTSAFVGEVARTNSTRYVAIGTTTKSAAVTWPM